MAIISGVLLVIIAGLLQVTLAGRVMLLQGPADLMLLALLSWNLQEERPPDWRWGLLGGLILSLSSALPLWVLLLSYASAAATAQFLRTRVWQVPMLTYFTAIVTGTLLVDGVALLYLWLSANPLEIGQAFNLVILPRIVLNTLLALPLYVLVGEYAKVFMPSETRA